MGSNQGWACVFFKRTQRSCILLRSFQKNEMFSRSFAFFIKRTLHSSSSSLRSFTFFIKERCFLCVLLHSLKKNTAFFLFFAFFYIFYKRTQRSLRSFTFFIKEHKRTLHSFWIISHTKMTNLAKKRT